MKKLTLFLIISALASNLLISSVYAKEETTPTPTQTPKKQIIREKVLREKLQDKRKEATQERKQDKRDFLQDLKQKIKGKFAKAVSGEVTAISGTTLTIKTKNGTAITVLTDANTKFVRNYWGSVSLGDIKVGHRITVFGRFTDDSKTSIQARLIRDQSLQKRHGVMFGEVTSKTDGSMVVRTQNRGDQTVVFDSNTKFINRRNQAITQADIQVGHRVRIKGLWDKTTKTLTQVREVKDFSIPQQPKPTKTPTP